MERPFAAVFVSFDDVIVSLGFLSRRRTAAWLEAGQKTTLSLHQNELDWGWGGVEADSAMDTRLRGHGIYRSFR